MCAPRRFNDPICSPQGARSPPYLLNDYGEVLAEQLRSQSWQSQLRSQSRERKSSSSTDYLPEKLQDADKGHGIASVIESHQIPSEFEDSTSTKDLRQVARLEPPEKSTSVASVGAHLTGSREPKLTVVSEDPAALEIQYPSSNPSDRLTRSQSCFRTLHASARGLLRTRPIASERQLYDAFCGRRLQEHEAEDKHFSRRSVNADKDSLMHAPLDWMLAIVLPAPGSQSRQGQVTEDYAKAIYTMCFRGEEYEESTTAFSLQAEAFSTELRSFMKAFDEIPHELDNQGKPLSGARRLSQVIRKTARPSEGASEEDKSRVPPSFQDLVRNAIVTKLVLHCGLRVKLIPAEDHQQIILLCSCSHYDLLREADRQSLPTELDVYAADPESLEPCTDTFIPLLYWFASSSRDEELDGHMKSTLSDLITRRREALEQMPRKAQAFHQNSTEFWETLRGFTDVPNVMQPTKSVRKKSFAFARGSKSSSMRSWEKDKVDPRAHFGSPEKAEQAKVAFFEYMKLKLDSPLGRPDQIEKEVNSSQKKKDLVPLRNYYDQLGVHPISAHAGFEVGTYLGSGQSTQCLWRHFGARLAPKAIAANSSHREYETHIATPFRNHQMIKLLVDIIGRQMDVGRLIDLGFVNSMFPLDSREKVEEPEQWVKESDDTGQEYWFNVDTKQASFDKPSEIQDFEDGASHKAPSILEQAWGFPSRELPVLHRGWILLQSFFVWPSEQKIRDYYGEEIALYFSLTQHLSLWCILPAGLGIVAGVLEWIFEGKTLMPIAHMIYGIIISAWGSCWLESWKRNEALLAATWGQLGITEQEVLRPAFSGVTRRSPIDFDNDMDRVEAACCSYGRIGRFPRQLVSFIILFVFALVHNALMALLLTFRGTWVTRNWSFARYSNAAVATVFALQMTLFSIILYQLCLVLNRWENYRTQSDYTKAFIIKQCALEFVNQFAIFFYIGYIKGAVDGCIVFDEASQRLIRTPEVDLSSLEGIENSICSEELREAVRNVLLAFACMNVVEIALPAIILPKLRAFLHRLFEIRKGPGLSHSSSAEAQRFVGWTMSKIVQAMLNKEVYSTVDTSGTYDDYIEIMVFFGHVSMFSLVFPFCPIIVMLLLVIEIRVDGHKLFYTLRRPLPKNAGSIGAWHYIFQFITWVSVVTNACMLTWGMGENQFEWLRSAGPATKWLFAVSLILGLVMFKAVIIVGVPDIPDSVKTLLLHHEWVCQQLSSNNAAMGPRRIKLSELDLTVHSAFSEQRTLSVDFAVHYSDSSSL